MFGQAEDVIEDPLSKALGSVPSTKKRQILGDGWQDGSVTETINF